MLNFPIFLIFETIYFSFSVFVVVEVWSFGIFNGPVLPRSKSGSFTGWYTFNFRSKYNYLDYQHLILYVFELNSYCFAVSDGANSVSPVYFLW